VKYWEIIADSRFFEIARVLVRLDHIARVSVNTNHNARTATG